MNRVNWREFQGGWRPGGLHAAVAQRDHGELRRLVESGADVDLTERCMTPLHVACERGDAEAVQILVACGASVDVPGPGGWTPLALAVARSVQKGTEILDILMAAGADPDIESESGETPRGLARSLDAYLRTDISRAFIGR